MTDESLCRLDALSLSRTLHRRDASCREAMAAYLARIGRLNPRFNAIVSLRDEAALFAEADRCDAELARGASRGWMHGLPHAVKDLEPTAGIRSTWGSPLFRDHVPDADGLLAQRLKAAGAIIIGKTNVPEWGFGSQTYNTVFGVTRNAYDPSRTCGGSSGGAAVGIALRMLPVADGSDMGGSLRNPAGFGNVFGLRPSRGRVPKWPNEDVFFGQLPTDGPMARSIPELAALHATLSGPDPRLPLSLPADPTAGPDGLERDPAHWRGVRIGWLGDYAGHLPTEPGVLELCERALQDLGAIGCTVEPTPLGFDPETLWHCFMTLRAFAIAGRFKPYHDDPARWALLKPEAQWEVERGLTQSGLDVYRGAITRSAWFQSQLALFERFDFLALPTAQVFPFDAATHWPAEIAGRRMDTYHRWMEVVAGVTLAGLPAISVPAGFDARGLPMGLQLIGRPQSDTALLQLAHAYDLQTRWVDRRPPPTALTGDPA
jgi:amidase